MMMARENREWEESEKNEKLKKELELISVTTREGQSKDQANEENSQIQDKEQKNEVNMSKEKWHRRGAQRAPLSQIEQEQPHRKVKAKNKQGLLLLDRKASGFRHRASAPSGGVHRGSVSKRSGS